ncbi:hypothetical protein BJ994_000409 [Arthrobacter pigmenti]|uniref:Lipoprotein n=1 Tax=Arthrobacter pigmenti TaxID=271432 RepID=A0A846RE85_9MICC|nr:hypothetical protein [Arthrobacter pigmenti]NJC21333.1 hypothetical protein [Arthrobacter pigmenti]
MKPFTGGVWARARPRVVVVLMALATLLTVSACVEIPISNPIPSPAPELSPLEELAAMPEVPVTELQQLDGDVAAFLTEDRNTYCAITTEQGGIINSPVDPRLSGGTRNDTLLAVPAVYCELARYPEPAEVTDDCHGTNLGFKGGTVLLTADGVTYGDCRVGMTLMEAQLGPGTEGSEHALTRLPVLADDAAVELKGFRCGRATDGLACVHGESGHGFVVSAAGYEIFAPEEAPESASEEAAER